MFRRKKITIASKTAAAVFEDVQALTDTAIERLTRRSNWLEVEIAKYQEELRRTDDVLGGLIDARASWAVELPDQAIAIEEDGTYRPLGAPDGLVAWQPVGSVANNVVEKSHAARMEDLSDTPTSSEPRQ